MKMATAVDLHGRQSRSWTGSLVNLNCYNADTKQNGNSDIFTSPNGAKLPNGLNMNACEKGRCASDSAPQQSGFRGLISSAYDKICGQAVKLLVMQEIRTPSEKEDPLENPVFCEPISASPNLSPDSKQLTFCMFTVSRRRHSKSESDLFTAASKYDNSTLFTRTNFSFTCTTPPPSAPCDSTWKEESSKDDSQEWRDTLNRGDSKLFDRCDSPLITLEEDQLQPDQYEPVCLNSDEEDEDEIESLNYSEQYEDAIDSEGEFEDTLVYCEVNSGLENEADNKLVSDSIEAVCDSLSVGGLQESTDEPTPINCESDALSTNDEGNTADTSQTETDQTTPEDTVDQSARVVRRRSIKKNVSFADDFGRSLTEVRLFHNEEPNYSPVERATSSINFNRSRFSASIFQGIDAVSASEPLRDIKWRLQFDHPNRESGQIENRLKQHGVALTNIDFDNPPPNSGLQFPKLYGSVQVKNMAFEKSVWIRLTTDHWRSHCDYEAKYNTGLTSLLSLNGARSIDVFTFEIEPKNAITYELALGRTIEFAVRYLVGPKGQVHEHWDNNSGRNYVLTYELANRQQVGQMRGLQQAPVSPFDHLRSRAPPMSTDRWVSSTEMAGIRTEPNQFNFSSHHYDDYPSSMTSYRSWNQFSGSPSVFY